jgi:hypothetical protein
MLMALERCSGLFSESHLEMRLVSAAIGASFREFPAGASLLSIVR